MEGESTPFTRNSNQMHPNDALDAEKAAKKEEMKQRMEEQRRVAIKAYLTSEAQERLHRIALVKPQKARAVEDMILQNIQMGRIAGRIDDESLVELLNRISDASGKQSGPKVTIQRRRDLDDE